MSHLTVKDFEAIIEKLEASVGAENTEEFDVGLYDCHGRWVLTNDSSWATDPEDGVEAIMTLDTRSEAEDADDPRFWLNDDYEFLRPLYQELVMKVMGWSKLN